MSEVPHAELRRVITCSAARHARARSVLVDVSVTTGRWLAEGVEQKLAAATQEHDLVARPDRLRVA
jgi:hypothetical protein